VSGIGMNRGIDVLMRLTLMKCYYMINMTSSCIIPFVMISGITVDNKN
jgi:hypothetical protein